jgi:uncharacterized DUF497 family protein
MRYLEAVVGFQWDANNSSKSQRKHAVTSTEAEEVFLNEPLVVTPDSKHSGAEERYHALGRTNHGRVLHITFTLRDGGTLIRVISARDASRKERKRFDEA